MNGTVYSSLTDIDNVTYSAFYFPCTVGNCSALRTSLAGNITASGISSATAGLPCGDVQFRGVSYAWPTKPPDACTQSFIKDANVNLLTGTKINLSDATCETCFDVQHVCITSSDGKGQSDALSAFTSCSADSSTGLCKLEGMWKFILTIVVVGLFACALVSCASYRLFCTQTRRKLHTIPEYEEEEFRFAPRASRRAFRLVF
jgi:hypothetical protein